MYMFITQKIADTVHDSVELMKSWSMHTFLNLMDAEE